MWCWHTDSNRGPTDYKSVALPTELCQRVLFNIKYGAGKENRTPILSLEGCDNTIILYPHLAEGVGVEPTLRFTRSTD